MSGSDFMTRPAKPASTSEAINASNHSQVPFPAGCQISDNSSRHRSMAGSTAAVTAGDRPMVSLQAAGWQPTTTPAPASPRDEPGYRARPRGSCCGRPPPAESSVRPPDPSFDDRQRPRAPLRAQRRRPGPGRRSRPAAHRPDARRGCRSRPPRRHRERAAGQPVGHLDSEAVVAQEDVADTRHQDPPAHCPSSGAERGSTSSGWKNR